MSYDTPYTIINRIKLATHESPIAVFQCEKEGKLDAMFANTVFTKKRINKGYGFIGKFHRGDLQEIDVLQKLMVGMNDVELW